MWRRRPARWAGATAAEAVTTSIAQGISVNVTLIFSPERYRAARNAYLSGLEQLQRGGHPGAEFMV